MKSAEKQKLSILIVEDDPDDVDLVRFALRKDFDAEIIRVDTGEVMKEALDAMDFDLVLCDFRMPNFRVTDALGILHRRDHDIPCIVVSGSITEEEAVMLMESGARDYLHKDNLQRLVPAIRRELRDARVRRELIKSELESAIARAKAAEVEQRAILADELACTNAELKETQSQLIQTAKMASLGELVAGIAHEVNNPVAYSLSHLATIQTLLNDLRPEAVRRLDPKSTEKFEKCRNRAQGIRDGLERVRDLVAKLRTFSRRDEAEFKIADIRENIESTLSMLGHRMSKSVTIRKAYAQNNSLYCAPGAINQVVMNLLTNAIDAVGDSGEITITTQRGRKNFKICVADSGPGVPVEIRERIFEPFFTTKVVGAGMGMGLAISWRIVERHGGTIEFRDHDGGGTEMVVRLPIEGNRGGNGEAMLTKGTPESM